MAHPMQDDAGNSSTAKFKRMTRQYGAADPDMVKSAPGLKDTVNGPQDSVGFGAEADAPPSRADRPGRRAVAANPIATYKRGGRVHEREKAEARASGGAIPNRADGGPVFGRPNGGKAKKSAATTINIVMAPSGQQQPTPPPVLPVGADPSIPPPMPPKPPMGAGPGAGGPPPGMPMPPGAMPPGLPPGMPMPPGRKRGGRVKHRADGGETGGKDDEGREAALDQKYEKDVRGGRSALGTAVGTLGAGAYGIKKAGPAGILLAPIGSILGSLAGRALPVGKRERAKGGTVKVGLDAGSATGEGRLEKSAARARRQAGDKNAEV